MIEHPYIKNADIKRWREATARGLPLLLSDIKNGKTQKGRRFYQLYSEYKIVAFTNYIKGDTKELLNYLYRSMYAFMLLLEKYAAGEVLESYVTYLDFQPMLIALLLNEMDAAQKIAAFYGKRNPDKQDHPYHVHLGLSIKKAILENSAFAEEEINRLQRKNIFKNALYLVDLYKAVYRNSQDVVNEILPHAVAEFDELSKREFKGVPDAVFFIEGLGALKLNQHLHDVKIEPPADVRMPSFLLEDNKIMKPQIDFG